MDEVSARAVLVPTSEVSDGVTTSIPRSELDEVLDANEMPIELVLDVARVSDGETSDTRTVAVSWERDQLERLCATRKETKSSSRSIARRCVGRSRTTWRLMAFVR